MALKIGHSRLSIQVAAVETHWMGNLHCGYSAVVEK